MSSLSAFLMRNKLDALGEKSEYSTADVNSLMPQQPSWSSPLAGLGSYQWSQEAGAKPNWFGRNVLSNIPPEAMHAANFLIPGKVPRIPNPIKAYHGSPHDFDKFDLSKVGTGEGAQAYGHGLYFAENPKVAESYKTDTGGIQVGGQHIGLPTGKAEFDAARLLKAEGGDIQRAKAAAAEMGLGADVALVFDQWQAQGVSHNPGKMYEVALHATPEQFIDWDKPLSGQSPIVKDAISSRFGPEYARSDRLTGGQFALGPGGRNELEGIPGIRYLDQGSRGAGAGTSNYVVWSPELIEILRKYAAPPAIAAPALASILQDQQSQ
jgi:hypothetical protein